AFQLRVLLHDEKAIEDRGRLALEQVGRVRFQQFAQPPEFFVDFRAVGIPRGKNLGAHVLQQYRIQLRDRLRRAEIGLHQLLAGAPVRGGGIPELAREAVLVIEQQPVLTAPCGIMQAHAATVRTLWASSSAVSQRRPTSFSIWPARPSEAGSCSSTSTSMSEWG